MSVAPKKDVWMVPFSPDEDDKFQDFLKEFQNESDRGAALVGSAFLDDYLRQIISSFLVEGKVSNDLLTSPDGALHSFAARTRLSFGLGLISKDEYDNLNMIREVRNKFAHSLHGLSFASGEITKLCKKLKFPSRKAVTPGWETSPRHLFILATAILAMNLQSRARRVIKERRVTRKWIDGHDWELVS